MASFKGIFSIIALGVFVLVVGCATIGTSAGERVRLKEPRIKPLPESEWTAEEKEILNRYRTPDGRFPNILTTLANHPELFQKYMDPASYFARGSTLPPREREIVILRVGWLCRSQFEFGWHTLYGKTAGLTDEEIKRITEGPKAAGWDPFDATLLLAVDELLHDAFITDGTWNALAKRYNRQQLMDVVFTIGQYTSTAMFLNSIGVQLDKGVPGFPEGKNK